LSAISYSEETDADAMTSESVSESADYAAEPLLDDDWTPSEYAHNNTIDLAQLFI
jgi:hypothetical protein